MSRYYATLSRGEAVRAVAHAARPALLLAFAACFVAGTLSSLLAALITLRIRDNAAGLSCRGCVCVAAEEEPPQPRKANSPKGVDSGPPSSMVKSGMSKDMATMGDLGLGEPSVSGKVVLQGGTANPKTV